MYYGNLRQKRQCKHMQKPRLHVYAHVNTGKKEKMQEVTPDLWHLCVLFLVGKVQKGLDSC